MSAEGAPKACFYCGYDRTGLIPGSRCPECGGAPPRPDGIRFLDQPTHLLARVSIWLVVVVLLQVLTLVPVVGIFTPSPLRFWLVISGVLIGIANLIVRCGNRLHQPNTGKPGSLIVTLMFVVFIGMVAVGLFGIWGSLGITTPIILVSCLALGIRGSISSSRWIEDDISVCFQEYAMWPPVVAAIVALASIWTQRSWDVVTIFTLGFLGWWAIQLIGDVILAWTSIVAIGHRHKLDGIESRRQEREDEWARDR